MKKRISFIFDENDYDVEKEMKQIINYNKYPRILWDFDAWLRDQIKHCDKDYQEIRDKFYEIVKEYDVEVEP